MEIAIIGGGASGLFAAIAARTKGASVTIYEKEQRVGRKILATGNGRCNMTNMNASEKDYHSGDISFIRGALKRFWVDKTLELFSELGILWKEEDEGKVYPYSDTASSVLDVLRYRIDSSGVVTNCGFCVKSVKKAMNRFVIKSSDNREAFADRVIIATGGKASPSLGSDGSGYELLKSFGHKITSLSPSLVQLKTEREFVRKLKGIKVNAKVTIGNRNEMGELLFTDYGISGPPVFSLSAYLDNNNYVYIDMMPEYTELEIQSMLFERCGYLSEVPLEDFFVGMLNKRVGQAVLKEARVSPLSRLAHTLSEKEVIRVARVIKNLKLEILGTKEWANAQVTKGGAVVGEFNPATMESKLQKGLYASGEVLDIDGDCGGYNLQWAWSSGYLAGENAARGE